MADVFAGHDGELRSGDCRRPARQRRQGPFRSKVAGFILRNQNVNFKIVCKVDSAVEIVAGQLARFDSKLPDSFQNRRICFKVAGFDSKLPDLYCETRVST